MRTSSVKTFFPIKSTPAADPIFESAPLVMISGQEPDTLLLYRTFLEMWRYRVVENEKPEELIEAIEKNQPDVV